MNTTEDAAIVRAGGSWLIWAGVVGALLGIGALMLPFFTGIAVVLTAGALLMVASIIQIIAGVKMDKGTKGRGWTFTGGLLGIVCAGAMFAEPQLTLAILTYVIAVFLVVDGVLRIAAAIEMKPERPRLRARLNMRMPCLTDVAFWRARRQGHWVGPKPRTSSAMKKFMPMAKPAELTPTRGAPSRGQVAMTWGRSPLLGL